MVDDRSSGTQQARPGRKHAASGIALARAEGMRKAPRLAVLSYHSWQVSESTLVDDIAALRRRGWRCISVDEVLHGWQSGFAPGERCCLLTSDDGHPEDERFVAALRRAGCPGVTFVNVSTIPDARRPFYRALAGSADMAVEDHGERHWRHFIGGTLQGFAVPGRPLPSGLRHRQLPAGSPICENGSEVAFPAFVPDPEAVAAAEAAGAGVPPQEIESQRWRRDVTRELMGRGLADDRTGQIVLRGRLETRVEYEARIREYFASGARRLEAMTGRRPRLYAYTWWQGSALADVVLRDLGYQGSFSGVGGARDVSAGAFAVPRLRADEGLPRPLAVEGASRFGSWIRSRLAFRPGRRMTR